VLVLRVVAMSGADDGEETALVSARRTPPLASWRESGSSGSSIGGSTTSGGCGGSYGSRGSLPSSGARPSTSASNVNGSAHDRRRSGFGGRKASSTLLASIDRPKSGQLEVQSFRPAHAPVTVLTSYTATPAEKDESGSFAEAAVGAVVAAAPDGGRFLDEDGEEVITIGGKFSDEARASRRIHVAIALWASLIVNIILFVSKVYSVFVSGSLSVAASAVDSFLDLLSQFIIFVAEHGVQHSNRELYPAGKSRLEPIGIILCACVMGMASLQLILQSTTTLVEGARQSINGELTVEYVVFDTTTIALLIGTIASKIVRALARPSRDAALTSHPHVRLLVKF
jgi:hypothetical protein